MAWSQRGSAGNGLIQAVAYADSAQDKLKIAEDVLIDRAAKHDSTTPINLVELDISDEEVKWIDLHVGHALNNGANPDQFPRTLVVSLAGAAMRADDDETLWADWARRTGQDQPHTEHIEERIPVLLQRANLTVYPDVAGLDLIRAHVGITASGMQALVETYLDEEITATRLALAIEKDDEAPWTLRRFLAHEPDLARTLITTITKFIDYTLDTPDWYAAERGEGEQHGEGLPSTMFTELVHVLAHREDYGREGTPIERVFTRPRVWVDAVLGTIQLRLTLPTDWAEADWRVSAPAGVLRVRQVSDQSTVDQAGHDVTLMDPIPQFTVGLPEQGREWDVDLFHPAKPVIFFNVDTGRRIGRIRRLRGAQVWAVAPARTSFSGDDGRDIAVGEPAALRTWSEWQLYVLNLESTTSVDIRFDQIDTRMNVQLDRRPKMRFATPPPTPGLVGMDGRPVFGSSPTITIPETETGEWSRRIFFLDGEERLDVFGEDLPVPIGATTDLFDASDDVWVGRYDVHVFHNGLFVASRIYNIAEGMVAEFDYDSSEPLEFRYPDARPTQAGITPASYHITYAGEKDIELGGDWLELDEATMASEDYLESQEGYGLSLYVVPQRLTYRLDCTDRAASWRSFPQAVDSGVVDPAGDLTVRLPQAASSVMITVVDISRPQAGGRTIELEAVTDTTFRLSTASLARFFHTADNALLSLSWMSPALGKKARTANLGLVTRQRLIADATREDDTLTVQPHQETVNLMAWAWALDDVAAPPQQVELDPVTFTAEVKADGPLIIDAAETGFVIDPQAPALPTERAVFVPGESDPSADWEAVHVLATLLGKNTDAVAELTKRQELLLAQPRQALETLASSPLSASQRVAALISSGLVAADEAGESLPEGDFWAGIIAAISDFRSLVRDGRVDSPEASAVLAHIRRLGGDELVATLRHGWSVGDTFASINKAERAFLDMYDDALLDGVPPVPQPWASENRRRQALTELYARRHLIAQAGVVPALVERVVRLENRVLKHATTPVVAMQATQRSEAQDQGDPLNEPWAWVPYISTTLSFLARLRAHDIIGPVRHAHELYAQWAQLAALVPQLTITDLVLADATLVSATVGPSMAQPEPEVDADLLAAVDAVIMDTPAKPEKVDPTHAHNRAVLDIHRTVIDAIEAFVQLPLPDDATPEELMARSGFVGEMCGHLRTYSVQVAQRNKHELARLLKKAEAAVKTTAQVDELREFLEAEEDLVEP